MAQANLRKEWIAQATINFADDEELLALASKAGCRGVFIGLESPATEGLREVGKKFNFCRAWISAPPCGAYSGTTYWSRVPLSSVWTLTNWESANLLLRWPLW